MTRDTSKACHAIASKIWGREAHVELRGLAALYHRAHWSDLSDAEGDEILERLRVLTHRSERGSPETPGFSTRAQRNTIAALRNALGWRWSKIRALVSEYGVSDWTSLTSEQADNLIRRLTQIKRGYAKRAERTSHTA